MLSLKALSLLAILATAAPQIDARPTDLTKARESAHGLIEVRRDLADMVASTAVLEANLQQAKAAEKKAIETFGPKDGQVSTAKAAVNEAEQKLREAEINALDPIEQKVDAHLKEHAAAFKRSLKKPASFGKLMKAHLSGRVTNGAILQVATLKAFIAVRNAVGEAKTAAIVGETLSAIGGIRGILGTVDEAIDVSAQLKDLEVTTSSKGSENGDGLDAELRARGVVTQ